MFGLKQELFGASMPESSRPSSSSSRECTPVWENSIHSHCRLDDMLADLSCEGAGRLSLKHVRAPHPQLARAQGDELNGTNSTEKHGTGRSQDEGKTKEA